MPDISANQGLHMHASQSSARQAMEGKPQSWETLAGGQKAFSCVGRDSNSGQLRTACEESHLAGNYDTPTLPTLNYQRHLGIEQSTRMPTSPDSPHLKPSKPGQGPFCKMPSPQASKSEARICLLFSGLISDQEQDALVPSDNGVIFSHAWCSVVDQLWGRELFCTGRPKGTTG